MEPINDNLMIKSTERIITKPSMPAPLVIFTIEKFNNSIVGTAHVSGFPAIHSSAVEKINGDIMDATHAVHDELRSKIYIQLLEQDAIAYGST